jgi:hypothetical protein
MEQTLDTSLQSSEYCNDQRFWFQWGARAFFDYICIKTVYKKVRHIVPRTFIPIIQLSCEDRDAVILAYQRLLDQDNEKLAFGDSPREKWRKIYGNLSRELEWGITEIYRYIPAKTANEVLIDSMARQISESTQGLLKFIDWAMARRDTQSIKTEQLAAINAKQLRSAQRLFQWLNFVYFIVGDVEIEELDVAAGTLKMQVTDCAFLRAGRMEKLPENGCLLFCKGACEKVFGDSAPMKMEFDPQLPETNCTITASWKHH